MVSDPPPGFLMRLAGPTEGGWRNLSVWESQEAFGAFRRERLEPALKQSGRPIPNFQIWQLHSVRVVKTP